MARREVIGRETGVNADLQVRSDGPRRLDPKQVEATRHSEPVARAVAPLPPMPRLALTIRQFCEAFSISEAFYYKLRRQGQGPREMELGARKLISIEAAAEWRRLREEATEAGASAGNNAETAAG